MAVVECHRIFGLDLDRSPDQISEPGWLQDTENAILRNGRVVPRWGYAVSSTGSAPAGTILKIFPIHFQDGQDRCIVYSYDTSAPQHNFYVWTPGGAVSIIYQVTLAARARPTFAISKRIPAAGAALEMVEVIVAPGIAGATTGIAKVLKVSSDGTVTERNAGITTPTAAPTCAAAAGTLTGVFTYKTAWEFLGYVDCVESAPSAESAHFVAAAQGITVTFNMGSTPSSGTVTAKRLYRRRTGAGLVAGVNNAGAATSVGDGVGADNNWYLVARLTPTDTAYTDVCTDENLGAEHVQNNNLPPPAGAKYVTIHRGRAFYVVENTIYYSELPDPIRGTQFEAVGPYSYFTLPLREGESITGAWSFGQTYLVFTQKGVYRVDTDQLEFGYPTIERIQGAAGCVSFDTIAELPASVLPGMLFYADHDAVYVFDGSTTRNLSKNKSGGGIQRFFDGTAHVYGPAVYPSLYYASGVVDQRNLTYTLSITAYGATQPKYALVYSIPDDGWTRWKDFQVNAFAAIVESTIWTGIYFARGGVIYRFGDQFTNTILDAGAAFTVYVTPCRFSPPPQGSRKHFMDFWAIYDRVPLRRTFYVGIGNASVVPASSSFTNVWDANGTETLLQIAKTHLGIWDERFAVTISKTLTAGVSADQAELCGFGFTYEPAAVRP